MLPLQSPDCSGSSQVSAAPPQSRARGALKLRLLEMPDR